VLQATEIFVLQATEIFVLRAVTSGGAGQYKFLCCRLYYLCVAGNRNLCDAGYNIFPLQAIMPGGAGNINLYVTGYNIFALQAIEIFGLRALISLCSRQ
jgi:hypothetical protein